MAIPRNLANLANQLDTSGNPPKVQVGDSSVVVTDTGSNGTITFTTDNAERMRIDSSGNVGIGTSSPVGRLRIAGSSANAFPYKGANFYLTDTNAATNEKNWGINSDTGSFNIFAAGDTFSGAEVAYAIVRTTTNNSASAHIWYTGTSVERMRIDSSGNVGIGTSSPSTIDGRVLHISNSASARIHLTDSDLGESSTDGSYYSQIGTETYLYNFENGSIIFGTNASERARITSGGNFLVGTTTTDPDNFVTSSTLTGGILYASGAFGINRSSAAVAFINRLTDDGTIVSLRQAGVEEGTISVSGTTVSYNGGNLSRYAQLSTLKDDTLLKGTVMSNLDEMNVYTDAEGNPVPNEQLNKVKVSDVEGDANVAGVFVNWSYDEAHQVDEINMAMTGDMIIRIAQGVVVQKGDLLMSAGDGTAKPQGDDIVRSKTVAKVTSNHVTCTYADGSYCVPCVLMAC